MTHRRFQGKDRIPHPHKLFFDFTILLCDGFCKEAEAVFYRTAGNRRSGTHQPEGCAVSFAQVIAEAKQRNGKREDSGIYQGGDCKRGKYPCGKGSYRDCEGQENKRFCIRFAEHAKRRKQPAERGKGKREEKYEKRACGMDVFEPEENSADAADNCRRIPGCAIDCSGLPVLPCGSKEGEENSGGRYSKRQGEHAIWWGERQEKCFVS